MSAPSGWYDDPQDPTHLRYWDGVLWTDHRTPKAPPAPGIPQMTSPLPTAPAAGVPQADSSVFQQSRPVDQAQTPQPPYGQHPGVGGYQPGGAWGIVVKATPDGVPLASMGSRLGARIVDWLLMTAITIPLVYDPLSRVGTYFVDLFEEMDRQARQGQTPVQPTPTEMAAAIQGPLLTVALVALAVGLLYESIFLLLKGATPGKLLLGIGVRLRERPGRLPLGAVLLRQVIWAIGNIPGLSFMGLVGLLDALWPLWDDKRQALHDKLAKTQVVRTR
jgi:uncharacterized RDD family membrane protein YckC